MAYFLGTFIIHNVHNGLIFDSCWLNNHKFILFIFHKLETGNPKERFMIFAGSGDWDSNMVATLLQAYV